MEKVKELQVLIVIVAIAGILGIAVSYNEYSSLVGYIEDLENSATKNSLSRDALCSYRIDLERGGHSMFCVDDCPVEMVSVID